VRLAVALLAALLVWPAAAARADGDPASDVLIKERVFYPYQLRLPRESTSKLEKTIEAARGKGYSVRVAMIAHDFDLGSAGLLYRKPNVYAKFLAQELAQFNSDWVLIVMPNGYGIFNCVPLKREGGYSDPCEKQEPSKADERLLASLPPVQKSGGDYAAASEVAVRRLAELHGASFGSPLPKVIGAAVAALVLAGGFTILRRRRKERAGRAVAGAGVSPEIPHGSPPGA
jgi:hypothetical protein